MRKMLLLLLAINIMASEKYYLILFKLNSCDVAICTKDYNNNLETNDNIYTKDIVDLKKCVGNETVIYNFTSRYSNDIVKDIKNNFDIVVIPNDAVTLIKRRSRGDER